MSETSGMHPKVINFFGFLANKYLRFFVMPPSPINNIDDELSSEEAAKRETEEDLRLKKEEEEFGDDDFSSFIRHACDAAEHYQAFYFGWIALACNSEKIRPRVSLIRDLSSNEEGLKNAVSLVRSVSTKAKEAITKIESLPDKDIEKVIKTISRYIKLFTLIYFK